MSSEHGRRAGLLGVLALAAAGCDARPRAAPTATSAPTGAAGEGATAEHPVAARLDAFEAAMCACTTMSCTAAVGRELNAWAEQDLEDIMRYSEDPARATAFEAGGKRIGACQQIVRDAATPEERAAADAVVSRHLDALDALADELCACTDGRCAEGVMKRFVALGEPDAPTLQQLETARATRARMDACLQRGLAGEGPRPPSP